MKLKRFITSPATLSAVGIAFFATSLNVTTVSAQTVIGRANNNTNIDLNAAWTGGIAPTATEIAGFSSSNNATSATSTVTAGVAFSVAGITYTNNPGTNLSITGGAGATMRIGSSGINLSSGTRALSINAALPVVLTANQTWTTGSVGNNSVQLTASSVISGAGFGITVNGTSVSGIPQGYISFAGANTFTGPLTLNSGGAVKINSVASASGGAVTSGAFGAGNLIINGGTIYGGQDVGAANITINGNFAVNSGAAGGANGRAGLGGAFELGNQTRTASLGRYGSAASVLASGAQSIRFNQLTNGPAVSVANGALKFVADQSTIDAAQYVSVGLTSATNFTNNSGLIIGNRVITVTGTSSHFGSGSNSPNLTVESGGIFNTSDGGANSRTSQLAGLNGSGVVTNLATAAGNSVITIGHGNASGSFSGRILDGAEANSALSLGLSVPATSIVSITKTGTGTQVFSGQNGYTGVTTVSAGTLQFARQNSLYNGNSASWTSANISVSSGATLAFNVGGSGEFTASDLDTIQTNLKTGIVNNGYRGGSIMGLDTTNAAGSSFTYDTALTNSTGTGSGSVGLNKLGTGTLVLGNATNTYTGSTTVTGGTLLVNGSTASTPSVTVASGALLGGTGAIGTSAGTTVVNGGIAPGTTGIGSFTVRSALTWNAGTAWRFDLGAAGISQASPGTSDFLSITNNNAFLKGTGSTFTFDFLNSGNEGFYRLVSWGSNGTTFLGTDFVATNLTAGLLASFIVDAPANSLYLQVTAIPEPSTYALAVLGMLGLMVAIRRRRQTML